MAFTVLQVMKLGWQLWDERAATAGAAMPDSLVLLLVVILRFARLFSDFSRMAPLYHA